MVELAIAPFSNNAISIIDRKRSEDNTAPSKYNLPFLTLDAFNADCAMPKP